MLTIALHINIRTLPYFYFIGKLISFLSTTQVPMLVGAMQNIVKKNLVIKHQQKVFIYSTKYEGLWKRDIDISILWERTVNKVYSYFQSNMCTFWNRQREREIDISLLEERSINKIYLSLQSHVYVFKKNEINLTIIEKKIYSYLPSNPRAFESEKSIPIY